MEEKSFSENAKGFFGAWKKDYENKNKDILERKKQRDAELDAMVQEMKRLSSLILSDLDRNGKNVMEKLKAKLEAFAVAAEKGLDMFKNQKEAEEAIVEAEEYAETLPEENRAPLQEFTLYARQQVKELGTGNDIM